MSYETEHPYQNYDPDWNPDEVMMRLHQLQNRIASTMSEVERKDGEITEKMSTIEQSVDNIHMDVYESNEDGTFTSKFDIYSDLISQKVSLTDYNGNTLVSMINQTATTIDIIASRINLFGAVSFLSDITSDLGVGSSGWLSIQDGALAAGMSNLRMMLSGTAMIMFDDNQGTNTRFDYTGLNFGASSYINRSGSGILIQSSTIGLSGYTNFNGTANFSGASVTGLNVSGFTKDNAGQGTGISLNSAGTLVVTLANGKTANFTPSYWSG